VEVGGEDESTKWYKKSNKKMCRSWK
jgi:hypothetical protein